MTESLEQPLQSKRLFFTTRRWAHLPAIVMRPKASLKRKGYCFQPMNAELGLRFKTREVKDAFGFLTGDGHDGEPRLPDQSHVGESGVLFDFA